MGIQVVFISPLVALQESVQFLRVGSSESAWDGCRTKRKGRRIVWSSSCWDGTTFCSRRISIGPIRSDIDTSTWRNSASLRVHTQISRQRQGFADVRNSGFGMAPRRELAAHVALALTASALRIVLSMVLGIPPYSLQMALVVIAILIPAEFVAILIQDLVRKRRRAITGILPRRAKVR